MLLPAYACEEAFGVVVVGDGVRGFSGETGDAKFENDPPSARVVLFTRCCCLAWNLVRSRSS